MYNKTLVLIVRTCPKKLHLILLWNDWLNDINWWFYFCIFLLLSPTGFVSVWRSVSFMEAVLGQKIQSTPWPGGQRRQQRGAALPRHYHLHDSPVPNANDCHILLSFSCPQISGKWCNFYDEEKCECHSMDSWLDKYFTNCDRLLIRSCHEITLSPN